MPPLSLRRNRGNEMTGYYYLWALLIAVSIWVSVGGFLWAHRHGQFRDQDRARFLPLRGEALAPTGGKGSGSRREALVMAGIIAAGISAILTVLVMAVLRFRGGGL